MVQTHVLPEERGGVYRMTLMFCMPGAPKLLGGLKKKNQKLDKVMSIYFIYVFFSFFCSQFLLCPNWSFSKRCLQNNGKDSGYLFIARSDSINVWTWVNMSFLFIYLFIFITQTFVFWLTSQYGDQAASSAFTPSLSKVTL